MKPCAESYGECDAQDDPIASKVGYIFDTLIEGEIT